MAKRKRHHKRRHMLKGSVALLGLADGPNGISPLYGALIGGGVAEAAKLYAQHSSNVSTVQNASLYGFGAGAALAAAAFFTPKYKHAAGGIAIGALLSAGIAYLETQFATQTTAAATTIATAAVQPAATVVAATAATGTTAASPSGAVSGARLGVPQINYLNGAGRLGVPQINYLNGAGRGLGLATISTPSRARGTIPGVAGPQIGSPNAGPPVNLLGKSTAASRQVALLGGPALNGLSAHYGATLMGGNR